MTAQIIEFPVIPRKAADRQGQGQVYHCIDCGKLEAWPYRAPHAIYCDTFISGAEMRPVEAK